MVRIRTVCLELSISPLFQSYLSARAPEEAVRVLLLSNVEVAAEIAGMAGISSPGLFIHFDLILGADKPYRADYKAARIN